jgi:hypothetical protein
MGSSSSLPGAIVEPIVARVSDARNPGSFDSFRAEQEFERAVRGGQVGAMVALLQGKGTMPSLEEVKAILRPSGEVYRSLQSVPTARIAGSEGRHADFDRRFRPRTRHTRRRWMSIFTAG